MLKAVLEYVQTVYLPGLQCRLAKWLQKCSLNVEYEEKLPTDKLGHSCLQEPVTRFIRDAVRTWFQKEGYSLDTLWVSRYRLLIRISLEESNGVVPADTTNSEINSEADEHSSFHTVSSASHVNDELEDPSLSLGAPLKPFPFCFF